MKAKLVFLAAALLACPVFADFQSWTSKDGRQAELELVRVIDTNGEKAGEFRMKNGRTITLKASELSAADAARLVPQVSTEIPKDSPYAPILSKYLVKLEGKRLASYKLDKAPQYIAFYFSAHWCPPCRAFTPQLVDFYNANHKENAKFEIVFSSHDNSEADMKTYMTAMKMPWPAIGFDKLKMAKVVKSLCGPGIPCLVVVDMNGKVIKDSYENGTYIGPAAVMAELEKLIKQ
jgi:nucleoredoxin